MKDSPGEQLTRRLVLGGEALYANQLSYWISHAIGLEVINEYGPTEGTVGCSTYWFSTKDSIAEFRNGISIGKPIGNVKLYLLDNSGGICPVGVAGEIHIGGEGLARGYLHQPALTAERFIADPFSGEPGARLYRTGDLGRWLPDGNIEYLGRIDDQVKVRGYRIEPGEIESSVLQSGLVQQCVVLARQDGSGNLRLVGYVVAENEFDRSGLLHYLRDRLPDYMVPAIWVRLNSIPLTSNGKVDKKALPDPDTSTLATTGFVAPRNELEITLAGIWRQLLGVERVGIHDNFFELGGNSLLIMRLASHLKAILDKKIGVITLFQYPTIKSLMDYLNENGKVDNKEEIFSKEELMKAFDKFQNIGTVE